MEKIIISNPNKFEKIKKEIIKGGFKNLHIVSDFDRTLTYYGSSTSFSVLRDKKLISKDYENERDDLFKHYYPFEISEKILLSEKCRLLDEWWRKHLNLFSKYKLNKNNIKKLATLKVFKFRNYLNKIINLLDENQVPFFIFSAGLGDIIKETLKFEKLKNKNIYIEGNFLKFNSNGEVIGYNEPLIHTYNKNEKSIKNNDIYDLIKNRKNVILIGDSLGDVQMIEGFVYNNLLKIGFLNQNEIRNLDKYKEAFDVVITNNSSLIFLYELLKEIK